MSTIAEEAPQIRPASADSAAARAEATSVVTASQTEIIERALIDASTRGPVLVLFATAVGWLLVATLLGLITAIKLHNPEFLADIPFLTYGRVAAASENAFLYGWCSLAGMGVAIWLIAR